MNKFKYLIVILLLASIKVFSQTEAFNKTFPEPIYWTANEVNGQVQLSPKDPSWTINFDLVRDSVNILINDSLSGFWRKADSNTTKNPITLSYAQSNLFYKTGGTVTGVTTFESPLSLGKNAGTSGSLTFIASDNDQANIAINTSDQLAFSGASLYSFDGAISNVGNLIVGDGGSLFTDVNGNVYTGNLRFRNKANDGWIAFADRNTSGADAVYDLASIGTLTTTGSATFGGLLTAQNIHPATDNTYYLGKNDDDTPFAYKGLVLKDQTTGTYYRIEVNAGVVTPVDLTD